MDLLTQRSTLNDTDCKLITIIFGLPNIIINSYEK